MGESQKCNPGIPFNIILQAVQVILGVKIDFIYKSDVLMPKANNFTDKYSLFLGVDHFEIWTLCPLTS